MPQLLSIPFFCLAIPIVWDASFYFYPLEYSLNAFMTVCLPSIETSFLYVRQYLGTTFIRANITYFVIT